MFTLELDLVLTYTPPMADRYEELHDDDEDEEEPNEVDEQEQWPPIDHEFEQLLEHPTLSPRQRSKELNRVMRAMVRMMVEVQNDESTAYAMDRTKRCFTEHQLENTDSKHAKAWRDAQIEYTRMGWKQQLRWRDHVMRTHPRLDRLVEQA